MKVIKFGGSSVSSAERIQNVIAIVKDKLSDSPQLAVVVSAFGGITDALIELGHQAARGSKSFNGPLTKLKQTHLETAKLLIPEAGWLKSAEHIDQLCDELQNVLMGVFLIKELSPRSLDLIMSFGERLSAYIISEAMKPFIPNAVYLDARDFIKTDRNFGNARVDYPATFHLIRQKIQGADSMPVITGFIGSSENQETTTLGRGGSDFTAAIIGSALNAEEIEIWTDVDGIMTADPRKVPRAFSISKMSYKEALEMSHFGAKILYPPTIVPALRQNIAIRIKNTFNPKFCGTIISNTTKNHDAIICGISSIDLVALLRVEGTGLLGVSGMAMRLFGALTKHEVSVILITQASSEHSICFAVPPQSSSISKQAIENEFDLEIRAGLIDPVILEEGMSVIAVVGEQMRHTPGIAGKLFGALGKNAINIIAIAQGSSEYNISLVVKNEDTTKALNVIHEEFFPSPGRL